MAINGGKENGKTLEVELQENLVNSLEGKDAEVAQQIILVLACTLTASELILLVETFKPLIVMRGLKDIQEGFLGKPKEDLEESKEEKKDNE